MGRDIKEDMLSTRKGSPSLPPQPCQVMSLFNLQNPWQARADHLNLTDKETKDEKGYPVGRLKTRRKPWSRITKEACSTSMSLVTPGGKVQRLETGNRL